MKDYQIDKTNRISKRLDQFLNSRPYTHLWQSPIWFQLRTDLNNSFDLYTINKNNEILACAQVIRLSFLSKLNFIYIPGGPVFADNIENPYDIISQLIHYIIKDYKKFSPIFLKIDPCTNDSKLIQAFRNIGFENEIFEIKPRATRIINLKTSEEERQKVMKYNTRYSIRKAKKANLEFKIAKTKKEFEEYYEIVEQTEERKAFSQKGSDFFKTLLETYNFSDPVFLLLVCKNNLLLSGGIFVKYQNRLHYLMGASNFEYKKYQGPSYLQSKAMDFAKKIGCDFYDFFSYNPMPKDKLSGPDRFKKSFGGKIVKWHIGMDLPLKNLLYSFYKTYHKVKR